MPRNGLVAINIEFDDIESRNIARQELQALGRDEFDGFRHFKTAVKMPFDESSYLKTATTEARP